MQVLPLADPNDAGAYDPANCVYDWRSLNAPTVKGLALKIFVLATRTPLWPWIYGFFARKSGIFKALRETSVPEEALHKPPTEIKHANLDAQLCKRITGSDAVYVDVAKGRLTALLDCTTTAKCSAAPGPTIMDYHTAYKTGKADPVQVTKFIIRFLCVHNNRPGTAPHLFHDSSEPPVLADPSAEAACQPEPCLDLRWMTGIVQEAALDAAAASKARWSAGKPLSVLDGIPFAVKDSQSCAGYPNRGGTRLDKPVEELDCPAVASLRAAGAIVVCMTTMPELGMSPVGLNPNHGTPRNPWNLAHLCGGSSSGAGALVGCGILPFALGSDAGGSTRVPAASCGVVGLFPTHTRIPGQHGNTQETCVMKSTCVGDGPLAGTAEDAALVYAMMARFGPSHGAANGGDAELGDHMAWVGTAAAPLALPRLGEADKGGLAGLRMGVYRAWFEDADKAVVQSAMAAVEFMKSLGAVVVELGIPDLELCRVAHTATLTGDSLQNFRAKNLRNLRKAHSKLADDLKFAFACASQSTSTDYVASARIRGRMATHMKAVFSRCDILVTPTVPFGAPKLAHERCLSHMSVVGATMKYVQLGNLLGLPAVTVPCGVDAAGLPVGLQLYGPAWHEASLLAIAHVLQTESPHFWGLLGTRQVAVNPLEQTVEVKK